MTLTQSCTIVHTPTYPLPHTPCYDTLRHHRVTVNHDHDYVTDSSRRRQLLHHTVHDAHSAVVRRDSRILHAILHSYHTTRVYQLVNPSTCAVASTYVRTYVYMHVYIYIYIYIYASVSVIYSQHIAVTF